MNMICMGDSLTHGTTEEKNICNRLSEKYPTLKVINLGISGEPTSYMVARQTSAAIYEPFIAMVWGGVNDIASSIPTSTIQANLQTMYTYFSTLGAVVWALTITPRDDNTAGMVTARNTVNTWIKTSAIDVRRVIDACAVIEDPSNTTIRLPAYAQVASPVHINDFGLSVLVGFI